jgi:flagellar hook assembly protein FlgD
MPPLKIVLGFGAALATIAAVSSASTPTEGSQSALASAQAVLDVTPPIAAIVVPTSGQVVSNVIRDGTLVLGVTGRVTGADLDRWVLDYGSDSSPLSWTVISTGSAPMANAFFGTWHTGSLTNGTYTIRFQVWDKAGMRRVATAPMTLANFTVTQGVLQFNASAGGHVTYTSVVPFRLVETLVVKDQQGRGVRTLVNLQREPGTYTDAWDGRDDAGALVPDGAYFFVATVTDGVNSMTWDLTHQYLNNYFDSKDSLTIQPFDPFNNRPMVLTYNSPVAGLVTISVFGTRLTSNECDQPPENALCLVNRRYEESGLHTFAWAGVDSTGVYRASAYSLLSITTIRDRFAKNAVVLFGTKPTVQNVTVTPPVFAPGQAAPTVAFDLGTYQNQLVTVTITSLNQSSLSVLRTMALPGQAPGHLTVPWDGRANNGMLVAPGSYTVTVTAADSIGNQVQGQILATVRP